MSIATHDTADYINGLNLNPYDLDAPATGRYGLGNSRSIKHAPGQSVYLSTGGRIVAAKDGSPAFTGPFLQGKVYEILIYRTSVSPWQLGQLSDRMLRMNHK